MVNSLDSSEPKPIVEQQPLTPKKKDEDVKSNAAASILLSQGGGASSLQGKDSEKIDKSSPSLLSSSHSQSVITAENLYNQKNFQQSLEFFRDLEKQSNKEIKKMPIEKLPPTANNQISDEEIIDHLFSLTGKSCPGFCIGENHKEAGAKEFIKKNLEYMKGKGLKYLAVETFSERHDKLVDLYINGDKYTKKKMNVEQKNKIDEMVKKQLKSRKQFCAYTSKGEILMLEILQIARSLEIQVVGINVPLNLTDHPEELETSGWNYVEKNEKGERKHNKLARNVLVNVVAKQRIDKEILPKLKEGEKFICLMGRNHVSKDQAQLEAKAKSANINVPIYGVADMLGCPVMRFQGTPLAHLKHERQVKVENGNLIVDYTQVKNIIKHSIQNYQNKKGENNNSPLQPSILQKIQNGINAVVDEIDIP